MFKSLSNRLVAALLGILIIVSGSLIGLTMWGTPVFLQELNQQLHLDLANNIVKEKKLIKNNRINHEALNSVFMGLMLVNPVIEVYLLDTSGKLLAWSAPDGVVKRKHVDIAPIQQFVGAAAGTPLLGNDPRSASANKVFSAAAIVYRGQLQGYLYVILGGQAYDSTVEMLETSYILRLWLVAVILSVVIAMTAGIFVFRLITWRVRRLADGIEDFRKYDFKQPVELDWHINDRSGDEIDNLAASFRGMSERIIQQVKQLEHQDSARRELIANVSHDLRTPLASLQGYLEVLSLKDDQLTKADRKKYVDVAWRQGERLHKLISELFELSTLENKGATLHFEPFSMAELIQDVTQKYQLNARAKQLVLNSSIPSEPAFVSADIGLIQRVLENLIENAIKYTPAGGEIDISLLSGKNFVATHIDDSGQGIPSEDMPHIFERFYRVDKHRDEDGTGLGLAIARRIMQLHNSSIDVASRPDVGTRFSFQLPVTDLRAL